MKRRVLRSFQYFGLPCLALCLALAAQANGHNFSADCKIVQVTKQDDNVEVKLSLRVINYSGADVKDATISLTSSLVTRPQGAAFDWEKEQTPFTNVTLRFNEHKIVPPLVSTFTIPAREYEQWQKGAGPRFVIDYQDASGEQQHQRIDVAPAP